MVFEDELFPFLSEDFRLPEIDLFSLPPSRGAGDKGVAERMAPLHNSWFFSSSFLAGWWKEG